VLSNSLTNSDARCLEKLLSTGNSIRRSVLSASLLGSMKPKTGEGYSTSARWEIITRKGSGHAISNSTILLPSCLANLNPSFPRLRSAAETITFIRADAFNARQSCRPG